MRKKLLLLLLFLGTVSHAQTVTNLLYYEGNGCSGKLYKTHSYDSASCTPAACTNGVETRCTWKSIYIPANNGEFDTAIKYIGTDTCRLPTSTHNNYYLDRYCGPNGDGSYFMASCYKGVGYQEYTFETFSDNACTVRTSSKTSLVGFCLANATENTSSYYSCGATVTNPPTTTTTTGTYTPPSMASRHSGPVMTLFISLLLTLHYIF